MSFADKADALAQARNEARAAGDAVRAKQLTQELDALYAARRLAAAQSVAGTREEIVRRARIETELERLMSAE